MLEIAVVLPTFCEAGNIRAALDAVARALDGRAWEAIVVDDHSPDGTADAARTVARADPRVRVIERIGRRGLSSAAIEGMLATAAPVVAVMDADLQHDAALLPVMLNRLLDEPVDLIAASRFAEGGGTGDWDVGRVEKSRMAERISRAVLPTRLSDPMSGFFMIRSDVARRLAPRLSGIGFKLLLDIVATGGAELRVAEQPYRFRARGVGESKLDHVVVFEFLVGLYDRGFGRIVPTRFVLFGAVGLFGLVVHMAILLVAFRLVALDFTVAQATATLGAMSVNFLLNNALTYRDRRLRGAEQLLRGWISFCLICGIGALANVGVASVLYEVQGSMWTLSALAGIAVGAVWNFALSSRFTWGRY